MDRTFWHLAEFETVEDEYPEDEYPYGFEEKPIGYDYSTEGFADLCDADTIARMTPEEFERI